MVNRSCSCCEEERVTTKKSKRPLKLIPGRTTMNKKRAVYVCEHCDGPALQLGSRKDKRWFDPGEFV